MDGDDAQIPEAWKTLPLSGVHGPVLIVGAADSGKSTLARYLYRRFRQEDRPAAYLDGDPGQSTLGPPATISLSLTASHDDATLPTAPSYLWFIGSTTPRGHMLPLLAGAARLLRAARDEGASPIIYDSSGLVDPDIGGAALKQALVDVLQPQLIIVIQKERELEALLQPWRRRRGVNVIELAPAPATRSRNTAERQAHRATRFAQYFRQSRRLVLDPARYAIIPSGGWQPQRLLALRDEQGFALALAILQQQTSAGEIVVHAPLADTDEVVTIEAGNLLLDPQTYRDQIIR